MEASRAMTRGSPNRKPGASDAIGGVGWQDHLGEGGRIGWLGLIVTECGEEPGVDVAAAGA